MSNEEIKQLNEDAYLKPMDKKLEQIIDKKSVKGSTLQTILEEAMESPDINEAGKQALLYCQIAFKDYQDLDREQNRVYAVTRDYINSVVESDRILIDQYKQIKDYK